MAKGVRVQGLEFRGVESVQKTCECPEENLNLQQPKLQTLAPTPDSADPL